MLSAFCHFAIGMIRSVACIYSRELSAIVRSGIACGRWAAIVFRSKDEADDIVDLYGGSLALNHPKLFEQGLVHLCEYYQERQYFERQEPPKRDVECVLGCTRGYNQKKKQA
jgi:hypothetical protein